MVCKHVVDQKIYRHFWVNKANGAAANLHSDQPPEVFWPVPDRPKILLGGSIRTAGV